MESVCAVRQKEFIGETIEWINAQDAFVLAVDLPSGIETDTGAVLGCAVRADVTVTFGFWKRGLFVLSGLQLYRKSDLHTDRHH